MEKKEQKKNREQLVDLGNSFTEEMLPLLNLQPIFSLSAVVHTLCGKGVTFK